MGIAWSISNAENPYPEGYCVGGHPEQADRFLRGLDVERCGECGFTPEFAYTRITPDDRLSVGELVPEDHDAHK